MDKKLKIIRLPNKKQNSKCVTVSLRISVKTIEQLDKISQETNRSRSEIINIMLEYGLENYEIT